MGAIDTGVATCALPIFRKIATISPKSLIRPDFLAKDEGREAGCACGEKRRASKKVSHLWEGRHRQTENCLAGRPDIDKGSAIRFAAKGRASEAKQIFTTRISLAIPF